MLSSLTTNKKILLVLAGFVILIAVLTCAILISIFRPASEEVEPTPEPVTRFAYCGAEPKEICLLSFGRDVYGNAIINFFVPDEEFPEFYLNILRTSGEVIYLCTKNEATPSNMICRGQILNLGEKVEIQVISIEEYRLLATGEFIIKAILIMPQSDGTQPSQTGTPTSTPSETLDPLQPIPTATPAVSYPSYP